VEQRGLRGGGRHRFDWLFFFFLEGYLFQRDITPDYIDMLSSILLPPSHHPLAPSLRQEEQTLP